MKLVFSTLGLNSGLLTSLLAVVLLAGLVSLLTACATVKGMGQDMENAGEWIQRNVRRTPVETGPEGYAYRSLPSNVSVPDARPL